MLCLLVIECTDGAHRLCPYFYDLEIQRAMLNNPDSKMIMTVHSFILSRGQKCIVDDSYSIVCLM